MKLTTKDLTLIALFAALTFVSSYIKIPIGPVPITAQTCFVLLTGLLLKPYAAFLAQVINLLLVIITRGGFGVFQQPSTGFLFGFILAATFIALICQKSQHVVLLVGTVLIASLLIYVIGVPYYMVATNTLNIGKALSTVFIPFIIGDLIKAAIAFVAAARLRKLI